MFFDISSLFQPIKQLLLKQFYTQINTKQGRLNFCSVSFQIQSDYTIINKINEGTFGIVYKAEYIKDHKIFALKELKAKYSNTEKLLKRSILMEIYACQNLHHKNIVNGYRYTFDGKIRISMEYCELKINELYNRNLIQKDRKTLNYFQTNNFIHCDIKPGNILVFLEENNDYSYRLIPKLCDYGLGIIDQKVKHCIKLSGSYAFTDGYRPPEVVFGVDISCKSDVFSLGVTFLELLLKNNVFIINDRNLSQQQTYEELYGSNVRQYVREGKDTQLRVNMDFILDSIRNMGMRINNTEEYLQQLRQEALFLCKMLDPNMKRRYSASELLQDEFLADVTERDDEILGQRDQYNYAEKQQIENLFNGDQNILKSYKFL